MNAEIMNSLTQQHTLDMLREAEDYRMARKARRFGRRRSNGRAAAAQAAAGRPADVPTRTAHRPASAH